MLKITRKVVVLSNKPDHLLKPEVTQLLAKGKNKTEVSKLLGIPRQNIYYILKRQEPSKHFIYYQKCTVCNTETQSEFFKLLSCKTCVLKEKKSSSVAHIFEGKPKYLQSGNCRTRELVRHRDNYTCQMCKRVWEEGMRRFDVHHLNGLCGKLSRKYDRVANMENMTTLCHKCHFSHPEHSQKNDYQ